MKRGDRCIFKTNLNALAMGAPVDTGLENFEEAILKLSIVDRAKLIGWISETMVVEEGQNIGEVKPSDTEPTAKTGQDQVELGEIRFPKARSPEERSVRLDRLNGSWAGSESAEKLIETIYSSRTVDDREYLHNE